MKHPVLAAVLSFFIPGAGLMYLGLWGWGALNLLAVTGVWLVMAVLNPGDFYDYVHYVLLLLAAGSAGLAHAVAQRKNAGSA